MGKIKVVIVDYGMGNVRSVQQALHAVSADLSVEIAISAQAALLLSASHIVLPGQGAMPDCMAALRERGLEQVVLEVAQKKPLLGICVGMQMLLERSAESFTPQQSATPALGLIQGEALLFPAKMQQADGSRCKIPQIGWNRVHQTPHALWQGIANDSYFYFVHSYYAKLAQPEQIAGTTTFGIEFVSAVARDNLFATQFHPEKSAQAGLQLYKNFLQWAP